MSVFRSSTVGTGEWVLDPADLRIEFRARGFWGLAPVTGRFTEATGALTWRPDGTASVRLDVVAASIDTGIGYRDRHLRSAEFLDTERFATISFVGDAGPTAGGLTTTGQLTVRGVATAEVIDVRIEADGRGFAGSADTSVELTTFGIRPRLGLVRPTVLLALAGRLVRDSEVAR